MRRSTRFLALAKDVLDRYLAPQPERRICGDNRPTGQEGRNEGMSFLAKDRIVAPPGYNRWLIPPAALCVHLCIGQAYAFSVFNLPLTKLIGITQSAPGDWKLTELGWIFSLAIFF